MNLGIFRQKISGEKSFNVSFFSEFSCSGIIPQVSLEKKIFEPFQAHNQTINAQILIKFRKFKAEQNL